MFNRTNYDEHENYVKDISKYFPIIKNISNKSLTLKIAKVWFKVLSLSNWERIEDACFNPDVNNQKLIDHINVTTNCSFKVAMQINKHQGVHFDYDLLIALGLLHDVSKLLEYEPNGKSQCKKTIIGEKIQHGFFGGLAAIEEGLSLDIVHLVLTHTPQSKMKTNCKEGILFRYIDLCNCDMLYCEQGLQTFYTRSNI